MGLKDQLSLWEKALKEHDKDAFSAIYHYYYPDLYIYSAKFLGHHESAQDALHDFFLYLWEKKDNLSIPLHGKSYLFKSLRRRLIEINKNNRLDKVRLEQFADEFNFYEEEIQLDTSYSTIRKERILQSLNSLPTRQKEILYLKFFEGLTNPEISDITGIEYQVVANYLYRAFQAIRKNAPELKELLISG